MNAHFYLTISHLIGNIMFTILSIKCIYMICIHSNIVPLKTYHMVPKSAQVWATFNNLMVLFSLFWSIRYMEKSD